MNTQLHNLDFDETALGSQDRTDAPAPPEPRNEGGITTAQTALELLASDDTPRQVIRGENPQTPENPFAPLNPKAALIDWLNFTFVYSIGDSSALLLLDKKFRNVFGFGLRANRYRGHLNYTESWELGDSFGVFAYGGSSVGGTAFFSISGKGCTATKDWSAVYDLLIELKANITRLDLAHDDFLGEYNIQSALDFYKAGGFNNLHGRQPKPKLINDFDSGAGKTFYIGNRKNGKVLRVYEKGKANGDPESPWVRWELELHSSAYDIPVTAIQYPGLYLAGAYPCLNWINATQLYFESVKQTQNISFDVLKKSCRNSYGKLVWTMKNVLGYSSDQIVNELSKKGIPARLNLPVVGGGDAI